MEPTGPVENNGGNGKKGAVAEAEARRAVVARGRSVDENMIMAFEAGCRGDPFECRLNISLLMCSLEEIKMRGCWKIYSPAGRLDLYKFSIVRMDRLSPAFQLL